MFERVIAGDDPMRPLDWRWRLAGQLLESRSPRSRKPLDPWVKVALTLRRAESGTMRSRRGRDDRALDAARRAHRLRHQAEPRALLALETLLVADMTHADIAARLAIEPDVVLAYDRLFFAVGEHPGVDAVLFALDPAAGHWRGSPGLEAAVKVLALRGGPVVAGALLDHIEGRTADPALANDLDLLLAAVMLPVGEEGSPITVRLGQLLEELETHASDRLAGPVFGPVAVGVGGLAAALVRAYATSNPESASVEATMARVLAFARPVPPPLGPPEGSWSIASTG